MKHPVPLEPTAYKYLNNSPAYKLSDFLYKFLVTSKMTAKNKN